MSAPRNASSAVAAVVVDELVRSGATEVVLAPGSRSAPLAFAAYAAAVEGRIRLHTRVDERSAGFLAIGMAKSSRRPVPVVTTSGTAVANLHPAVLEASHAGVPLVVLTADRPAALRGTNANQTTDQVKIFGHAVREFADVPAAAAGEAEWLQVTALRSLVCRLVASAAAGGPVHLNLQLAEPLTPSGEDGWSTEIAGRAGGEPWTSVAGVPDPDPTILAPGPRTVVVAGDDAGPPARALAERANWPLFAEPTSGSRTGQNAIRTYRLLLRDSALADRIERVVACGHPTLSRPVGRLMARDDVEVVAVRGKVGWTDAGHQASVVLAAATVETADDAAWLDEWRTRDHELSEAADAFLDKHADLTPQEVAGTVSAALPAHGLLFVGASNPVRDLDLMATSYPVGEHRMVLGNRGLSGIDGSVSTAIGAALARAKTSRALALLGDVTFLHDCNGLVIGPDEVRPDLTIVVVNDDGGSIFASLEQGAPTYADSYDKLFGTPHGVDIGSLCAATGTPHRRVADVASLREAVGSPPGGIDVVEAVVRRDNRRELDATLRGLVG